MGIVRVVYATHGYGRYPRHAPADRKAGFPRILPDSWRDLSFTAASKNRHRQALDPTKMPNAGSAQAAKATPKSSPKRKDPPGGSNRSSPAPSPKKTKSPEKSAARVKKRGHKGQGHGQTIDSSESEIDDDKDVESSLSEKRAAPEDTPLPTAGDHQDTAVKAVKKAAPRPKKDAATKSREEAIANNLDLAYNYWSTSGEMDASLGFRAKSCYDRLMRQQHKFPHWVVPIAERMEAVRITPS